MPMWRLSWCRPRLFMPTFGGNSLASGGCSPHRTFTTGIMPRSLRRWTRILPYTLRFGTGCLERFTSPDAGPPNMDCVAGKTFHRVGCCSFCIPFAVDHDPVICVTSLMRTTSKSPTDEIRADELSAIRRPDRSFQHGSLTALVCATTAAPRHQPNCIRFGRPMRARCRSASFKLECHLRARHNLNSEMRTEWCVAFPSANPQVTSRILTSFSLYRQITTLADGLPESGTPTYT